MSDLPRHLLDALGRGHAKKDVPVLVGALEAHGVAIKVVRLQLGDPRAEGFGRSWEVYRTRTKQESR